MSFNNKLFTETIEEKKYTNQDLVDILKNKYCIEITIDTIKSYRQKSSTNAIPRLDELKAFSEILDISIEALLGGNILGHFNVKPVPIVGTVSCGAWDINHLQDDPTNK